MKAILCDSDVDSSGEIDFDEFQGLYARVILEFEFTQQEQMLRDAQLLGFTDEDHVLECKAGGQLVVVISQTLAPCSFITVKEIFDIIDTDHSGELDIREVRKLIVKSDSLPFSKEIRHEAEREGKGK
eukprot:g20042.t1